MTDLGEFFLLNLYFCSSTFLNQDRIRTTCIICPDQQFVQFCCNQEIEFCSSEHALFLQKHVFTGVFLDLLPLGPLIIDDANTIHFLLCGSCLNLAYSLLLFICWRWRIIFLQKYIFGVFHFLCFYLSSKGEENVFEMHIFLYSKDRDILEYMFYDL